jgi:hypothetical protein
MIDNIKLSLSVPFADNAARETFCARFGLFTKNEKLGIWHNKGDNNLSQNKGVYMHLKNRKLTLEFSLHKVHNYFVFGKQFNYNDFTFAEATQAAAWLAEMFNPYFDIMQAAVKKYEIGINVLTSESPDLYLQELKQMNVCAKVLPIKEDIHYKEYKQFSTQRDKDKRIIYIFYNKTFEARSKERKQAARANIPENLLRVEKDNKRPIEKILFARLFDIDFQQLTINEFKQRFCNDLEYKGIPIKPENMKHTDYEMLCLIYDKGTDGANTKIQADFENGIIPQRTYYRKLQIIKQISGTAPEIKTTYSQRAVELNNLIIRKIQFCQKWQCFE